jgi:hypothetical protein
MYYIFLITQYLFLVLGRKTDRSKYAQPLKMKHQNKKMFRQHFLCWTRCKQAFFAKLPCRSCGKQKTQIFLKTKQRAEIPKIRPAARAHPALTFMVVPMQCVQRERKPVCSDGRTTALAAVLLRCEQLEWHPLHCSLLHTSHACVSTAKSSPNIRVQLDFGFSAKNASGGGDDGEVVTT